MDACFLHELGSGAVNFGGGDTGCDEVGEAVEDFRRRFAGTAHLVDFGTALNRESCGHFLLLKVEIEAIEDGITSCCHIHFL